MLFPKPIINSFRKKQLKKIKLIHGMEADQENKLIESQDNMMEEEEDHDSFGELFVHQMIETIEYVLGSISNTASYLRLWALSLAHGELTKVFYDMLFGGYIKQSESVFFSMIGIVLGFSFFMVVNIMVIMVMDSMECFLHALRLHWVEFQNKFFKGEGLAFTPFRHTLPEIDSKITNN